MVDIDLSKFFDRVHHQRLLSRLGQRIMDAKIRELTPRNFGQSLERGFARLNAYLRGWSAFFRICTAENVRVLRWRDAHIRRRMRAIVVRRMKRPRFLFRHLLQRGAGRRTAGRTAYCRRGPWFKSHTYAVEAAYPNAWFHERLVSLVASWEKLNPTPSLASGQTLLFDL